MKVLVTGASGLIGSALVDELTHRGDEVLRLVRRPPRGTGEVQWDPTGGQLDPDSIEGVDAVVHLAGESIGAKRWNAEEKRRIRESRILGTHLVAKTLSGLERKPSVLVSGSAIGIYGNAGDAELDEGCPSGDDFLADLVREWEAATDPAGAAGIRVVHLRTGLVQSAKGGGLGKQLPLFRLGLGGRLGSGRQWMSWIAIDDEVGAILHAIATDSLHGAVNSVAPNPVTNTEYTRVLGRVLGRPALLAVPPFALSAVLGRELVHTALLASQRAMPVRLEASGYQFKYPELEGALRHVLGKEAT